MESSLQKIIAAIVGVLILFIIPVYIAFEKVDDVSYTLALKLTQNFVDNVTEKGYISPEMYNDFVSGLYATNTSYDVKIEHVKKRIDPVVYVYERSSNKLIHILDYDTYTEKGKIKENKIVVNDQEYTEENGYRFDLGHIVNEEIISDKQILDKLFSGTSITKIEFLRNCLLGNADLYNALNYMNENSYIMNEGDKINVSVKNTNQTIASVFYSMLTANVGGEDVAKIYVSYGGTIKNSGEGMIKDVNGLVTSEKGRIFKYIGQAEEITLAPGIYEIKAWGASGGGFGEDQNTTGGKGAYTRGVFELTKEMTLYVYVGGEGTEYSEDNEQNGGYNGGGNSYNGFGGGGASDVRLLKGEENDVASLLTRIITAGGGGGSSKVNGTDNANNTSYYGAGGFAGNQESAGNGLKSNGAVSNKYFGKGAINGTISVRSYSEDDADINIPEAENGNLGTGGSVDFDGAGAGGGGYFGGSASHNEYAGGGGGLSFIYKYPSSYDPFNDISGIGKNLSSVWDNKVKELTGPYTLGNKWNGIEKVSLTDSRLYAEYKDKSEEIKSGKDTIPANPLLIGANETTGNKGNGVVIIKKISN